MPTPKIRPFFHFSLFQQRSCSGGGASVRCSRSHLGRVSCRLGFLFYPLKTGGDTLAAAVADATKSSSRRREGPGGQCGQVIRFLFCVTLHESVRCCPNTWGPVKGRGWGELNLILECSSGLPQQSRQPFFLSSEFPLSSFLLSFLVAKEDKRDGPQCRKWEGTKKEGGKTPLPSHACPCLSCAFSPLSSSRVQEVLWYAKNGPTKRVPPLEHAVSSNSILLQNYADFP